MEQSAIDKIVAFINSIGIPCRPETIYEESFLPGVIIKQGCILYDPELLKYPGDLLHEAGHLAVLSSDDRQMSDGPDNIFGNLSKDGAELAAIAWSWAALQYLKLPPGLLFHEHGYKGASASLIENFSEGRYIGVPLLHWMGMVNGNMNNPAESADSYPHMAHWLRQA